MYKKNVKKKKKKKKKKRKKKEEDIFINKYIFCMWIIFLM